MGSPSGIVRGSVVLIRFPFSDLSETKLRPAVVLAAAGRGDFILVQLTSQPYSDPLAVALTDGSFENGSLQRMSFARPGKLFTAHDSLFERSVAQLSESALTDVVDAVVALLRA